MGSLDQHFLPNSGESVTYMKLALYLPLPHVKKQKLDTFLSGILKRKNISGWWFCFWFWWW